MKKLSNKIWELFFTYIMGVEFIPDNENFKVHSPIGKAMCDQEVMFGAMFKVNNGLYKFNKECYA